MALTMKQFISLNNQILNEVRMDTKEMIDEIEKPSDKCDHIIGTADEFDLEKQSGMDNLKETYGEKYTKEDNLDKVFKYCPECGEKLT